ncbi:MAG: ATPase, T2SS/T4P/T4SS family, partial [Patescibacteria group bacterium]
KSRIAEAIEDYYSVQDDGDILDSPVEEMEDAFPGVMTMTDDNEQEKPQAEEEGIDIEALERSSKESPTVRLVNLVLVDAVKRGASEIHIEPYEKQFDIRYRLDGELHAMMRPPLRLRNVIVSRIKIMAAIDIIERRKVQNGKISLVLGKDKYVTFYVSTMPVLFGEKMVLRVRDAMKVLPLAAEFTLSANDMEGIKQELARPGIKVVYGPARSGKTSLLRLVLSEMGWGTANVIAIGDVDVGNFAVGNVNCVQLDPKFGLTGARVMAEACYGQSADVIMMDGMLDADTAKEAVNAALSGKVVILSMAVGSAAEARSYLAKLVGDDTRLDLALNLFLGVRLLRRLCPECKAPFADKETLKKSFPSTELPIVEKMRVSVGCCRCNQRGYFGQVGICEVAKNTTGQTLGASMQAKTRQLLEAGTTTLEEVVRQKS